MEWVFELEPNEYEIIFSVMFGLSLVNYAEEQNKQKQKKKTQTTNLNITFQTLYTKTLSYDAINSQLAEK